MKRVPVLAGGDILVTRSEIARMLNIPRSTARYRMNRLRARDLADGKPTDWFIPGEGRGSADRYNLTRLERAHPALFKTEYVDREDFSELLSRMDSFEAMLRDQKTRLNATIAGVREIRRLLKTG